MKIKEIKKLLSRIETEKCNNSKQRMIGQIQSFLIDKGVIYFGENLTDKALKIVKTQNLYQKMFYTNSDSKCSYKEESISDIIIRLAIEYIENPNSISQEEIDDVVKKNLKNQITPEIAEKFTKKFELLLDDIDAWRASKFRFSYWNRYSKSFTDGNITIYITKSEYKRLKEKLHKNLNLYNIEKSLTNLNK